MIKLSNLDSQAGASATALNPTSPAGVSVATAPKPAEGASPSILNLLTVVPSGPLVPAAPVACPDAPTLIDAKPLPAPAQPRKIRRNGRVACLPRIQRDMVNHMLWNAVPYKNIVAALDEAGFTVTERNISNWATGGYLEWRLEQEHVLENRLDQDHLLDFLRRDDAPELPEVGLQAAATRLSQLFLQKLAHSDDPESHLDSYSKLIDILCRLNREIAVTQKQRDDSRRTLGREYDPALVREEDRIAAIENERYYSDPPSDSALPRPSVPPALPPIPTDHLMAEEAREARNAAKIERLKQSTAMLQAFKSSLIPASKQRQNPPAPASKQLPAAPTPVPPAPAPLALPPPVTAVPPVAAEDPQPSASPLIQQSSTPAAEAAR